VRELLEVFQAAGLSDLDRGHCCYGRRRQPRLLCPPPETEPRHGRGRRDRGKRGDVEEEHPGEAICTSRKIINIRDEMLLPTKEAISELEKNKLMNDLVLAWLHDGWMLGTEQNGTERGEGVGSN
jgi:hypothetical protein